MKYIKTYKTYTEYIGHLIDDDIIIPSISYIEDIDAVDYHPYSDMGDQYLQMEEGDNMLMENYAKIKLES